jgi:hypothetical protein
MLRRSLWAAPAALALAGSALARPRRPKDKAPSPPPPPPPAPGPSLLGAWALLSAETVRGDGQVAPAFGDRVNGLLIYDRSGEMSLQIAGDRPGVGGVEAYQSLSPQDRLVFLDSYYAYFGTFEVDEAAHVVIHRVRASLRPNETGASYRRQFGIEGERLTLATPPEARAGEMLINRLIFVRAHAPA